MYGFVYFLGFIDIIVNQRIVFSNQDNFVFSLFFGWLIWQDLFYESEDYCGVGGNGINYWIYDVVSLCKQKIVWEIKEILCIFNFKLIGLFRLN